MENMNFSFSSEYLWFIDEDYKKLQTATLIQIEIYKDSARSILAVKRDSFIGIFKSIDEIDIKMKTENRLNIKSLGFNTVKEIQAIAYEIIHFNDNLDKIDFELVNEEIDLNPAYNLRFLIRERFNEIYKKVENCYLKFAGDKSDLYALERKNEYIKVHLHNWNDNERFLLYTDSLKVIYEQLTEDLLESFDEFAYISINQSLNGEIFIQLNKASIKFFTSEIKKKLWENKHRFPILIQRSEENVTRRASFNNEYYNDELDMDQQSPEFWNSL